MKALIPFCLGLATLLPAGSAMAQAERQCGSLKTHYGPFDYRTANEQQKSIVEDAHFTPGVETLTAGKTGSFGGDIRYTLFAFPNHPRALLAMERLVEKERRNPARDAQYTVECYYERALRWRPNDHIVRLLYANFLIKQKQTDEAQRHVDFVADATQDNPFAQFNAGMLYLDMKLYDKALVQAHRVMAMGMERRELRERLTAAGRWVEPPPEAASAPASGASAPASGPSS
ncbi:MAG: tetratricopeptide repeat protein [Burkholderiales bacterium]|nr:MAG: tetratricopeptide repeat protein [Burkholderiales bacterium]